MKVVVLGHLIDTSVIYTVSPVRGNHTWSHGIEMDEMDELTHSGYSFTIKFLNLHTLVITVMGDDLYKNEDWWQPYISGGGRDYAEYRKRRDRIKEAVITMRKFVIANIPGDNKYPTCDIVPVKL